MASDSHDDALNSDKFELGRQLVALVKTELNRLSRTLKEFVHRSRLSVASRQRRNAGHQPTFLIALDHDRI